MASAKTAVQASSLALVPWTANSTQWTTVLGSDNPNSSHAVTIKMPAQKDLLITVSLECGLYTKTLVKSKGGVQDTSIATASIKARVVIDGHIVADPGEVTFNRRSQELSATLQGIIGSLACFPNGVFDPNAPGCVLTEEQISLMLDTLDANAFVFGVANVGTGNHNIVVQTQINLGTTVQSGSADAHALVGKGTVEVEDVRLLKNSGIIDLS